MIEWNHLNELVNIVGLTNLKKNYLSTCEILVTYEGHYFDIKDRREAKFYCQLMIKENLKERKMKLL